LGKWLIGVGEKLFGYHEFGWRISAAVAGTIAVLIVIRLGRRLFRSTLLGCAAGLLMALDGFQLVLSRVALLDIFLLTFVLAAFAALVMDREQRRRRWLRRWRRGWTRPCGARRAGRLCGAVVAAVRRGVDRMCDGGQVECPVYIILFVILIYLWEVGARRVPGCRVRGGTRSWTRPVGCSPSVR